MNHLKRLSTALVLTLVVAISANAGISETPPCAEPGQTSTPPCAVAQAPSDESEITGQTETSAASAEGELSMTDLMLDVIQGALFLF